MTRSALFLPLFLLLLALVILAGCGKQASTCPAATGTPLYLAVSPEALPTPTSGPMPTPVVMEIGGKPITVDKVVEGPLCNDTWSGIVYVTCNIQVYQWEDQPTFLKNCNLTIDPDTVVYVAYHNNAAYYKGCSCHTGETPGP